MGSELNKFETECIRIAVSANPVPKCAAFGRVRDKYNIRVGKKKETHIDKK